VVDFILLTFHVEKMLPCQQVFNCLFTMQIIQCELRSTAVAAKWEKKVFSLARRLNQATRKFGYD
jgi:hypothetical protein